MNDGQYKKKLDDLIAVCRKNLHSVDEDLLRHAPSLRVVGRLGVGLDNLDLPALRSRGVTVVAGGDASAIAVAEYTIAAMLALVRMLPAADASTKAGGWERQRFTGSELRGKALGLIGLGGVGMRVARRAAAFDMRLLAHDPARNPGDAELTALGIALVSLDSLLSESDFVSIHVPLIESTRNLVDARALGLMRSTAYLINSSRGGIVDEAALAAALSSGRITGAALDVRCSEPPGRDDPLAGLSNVLLTPHIAGLTQESQDTISANVARDVIRVLGGELPKFGVA